MDGSLLVMEGCLLLRFLVTPMDGSLVIMGGSLLLRFLVTPMDGNIIIMGGSMFLKFLLFQWMVALSLWKVVRCRDFCYSNGW